MRKLRLGLLALTASIPLAGNADIVAGDMPPDTVWYLHVNFEELRSGETGKGLNDWLKWEVYDEIDDELGINLNEEVNQFTAFSGSEYGTVIVIDGPLSKVSQDKLLAIISTEERVEPKEYEGKTYYHVGDEEDHDNEEHDPFEYFDDTAYFSFSLDNRAIVTATEAHMHELLDNGGEISGSGSHDGALLVLSAKKSLIQAGLQTDGLIEDDNDDGWESNIVRNTEQAALLMADDSGQFAIEAQLVSTDPKMAAAIGGIVNGLISLQAFNSELGPELQSLIGNTKVEVLGNVLSISTVIDPELIAQVLND